MTFVSYSDEAISPPILSGMICDLFLRCGMTLEPLPHGRHVAGLFSETPLRSLCIWDVWL